MRRTISKAATLGLLIVGAIIAQAAQSNEPALSSAQTAAVARQIATLRSPAERHMAEGWSNSKKVAEMICRPAALIVLKKQDKTIDRVFLGTEMHGSLTLESNSRLTGNGEFRTSKGWQDFTFTCDVSPETGKVTAFQPVLKR